MARAVEAHSRLGRFGGRPRHVSGRAALWVALGLVAGAGCFSSTREPLPFEDGVTSLLLVHDLGRPGASALVVSSATLAVALPRSPLIALAYDATPESLQLPEGGRFVSLNAGGRPLPQPNKAWQLNSQGRWEPLRTEPNLASFLLPPFRVDACIEGSGCLSQNEPLRCQQPCPLSPVAPPNLPQRPCPRGWIATPVAPGGPNLCAPPLHPELACPSGQRQAFDEDGCQALMACEAGPWPAPPPGTGRLVHVRPGATSGDGSPELPFSSLAQALLAAGPQGRILLGQGTLQEEVTLSQPGVQIVGLCPGQSHLEGQGVALQISASDVRVRGLSITSRTAVALELTETASATVAGVQLSSPVGNALRSRGQLTARHVRVEGEVGVELLAGSAQLLGAHVQGSPAITCSGQSDLRVSDAQLLPGLSPGSGLGLLDCGQVTLQKLAIYDAAEFGISGDAYRNLRATDLRIVRPGEGGLLLESPNTNSKTLLARILIGDSQGGGLQSLLSDLIVDDIAVAGAKAHALNLLAPTVLHADGVRVRGVWISDSGTPNLVLGRAERGVIGLEMELQDVVVTRPRPAMEPKSAVRFGQDITSILSRAWIEALEDCALSVACGDATLSDLTVSSESGCGIAVQAEPQARINRTSIRTSQVGLRMDYSDSCTSGVITTEDLKISGGPGARAGVELSTGTPWVAQRFSVRGFQAGVDVRDAATLTVSDGRLERNEIGVSLPREIDLVQSIRGVSLDNEKNILQR